MKTGTVEYYMAQDYPIEIRVIPEDWGGGYSASIPELGRAAFYADGDTVEEALSRLNEIRATLFADMLSRGKKIPLPSPLPEQVEEEELCGRVLLRIPKDLHRDIVKRAEANGVSVNQFISNALSKRVGAEEMVQLAVERLLRVESVQTAMDANYWMTGEKADRKLQSYPRMAKAA